MPGYSDARLIQIQGRINWPELNAKQAEGDLLFWLPLGDVRGVREVSTLNIGDTEIPAKPLGVTSKQNSGLQFTVPAADRNQLSENYHLTLKLAGSHSLVFLPLADTTRVTLESDWPHPEFIGQFLPVDRTIDADGSLASWQLLGVNRPYGDHWLMSDMSTQHLSLLLGSLALLMAIAALMFLTRNVDWYNYGDGER